jgi:nicotinate phosphoribosyltransferase
VELKGCPRIKLSQDLPKVTIPGQKRAYRLYGKDGKALVDYLALLNEESPGACGEPVVCRDPFQQNCRLRIRPSRVVALHHLVFDGKVKMALFPRNLSATRKFVSDQLQEDFSDSITRYNDPVEYGVMVSLKLYHYLHNTWEKEHPIQELE